MRHTSQLTYPNNDSGIWLDCSCGWSKNLGYFPEVNDVVQAWTDHLYAPEKRDGDPTPEAED